MPGHSYNLREAFQTKKWGKMCTGSKLGEGGGADVEIVVYPGILVLRKYLSWQKIFGKMLTFNCKIDYTVR